MEETRVCVKCGAEKPITKFSKRSSRGRQAGQRETVCTACKVDQRAPWGSAPSQQPEYQREYYWTTRRWLVIERRFGLTKERYEQMWLAQGNKCAGCLKEFEQLSDIRVDHDHACCPGVNSCGKCVRGMVCHNCNVIMGLAHDNLEVLQRLAAYLS